MQFYIDKFLLDNYDLNSRVEISKNNLKLAKNNLNVDTTPSQVLKNNLDKSKKLQKDKIVQFEQDKDRFKLLKRYGEILQKIEKLYSILPTNTDNLSTEELVEAIEKLIKTKKQNEMQIVFIFLQSLYTNSLKNLINIEKDFQDGNISQSKAKSMVINIKIEIENKANHVPKQLEQTHAQVKDLIEMYEQGFSKEHDDVINSSINPYVDTDLNIDYKLMFEHIENQTNSLISKVSNLDSNLSSFEPQVDLSNLEKNMAEIDNILQVEKFDADRMETSLNALENTNDRLTTEQVEKNEINQNLSNEIDFCLQKTEEFSKNSTEEVTTALFLNAKDHATICNTITEETTELLENTDAPTEVIEQVALSITSQLEADEQFCDKVSAIENAATENYIPEETQSSLQKVEELKELVNEKLISNEEILTLKQDDENKT